MTESCYCCDNDAVGQGDHVPPKSFFAVGTFASSAPIIVPSCADHNQGQSAADEYLKFILASSAGGVPEDVRRAAARSAVRHAKNPTASLRRYGMERTDQGLNVVGYAPVESDLLDRALSKVARGIYYHHHRRTKKLIGDVEVHPIFLGIVENTPPETREVFESICGLVSSNLRDFQVHGDHPEVFAYQVFDRPEVIAVNMVFYRTKIALVLKRLLD